MENISHISKSMHTLMVDPFMFNLNCFTKTLSSNSINDNTYTYNFQLYPADKTFLYKSYSSFEYSSSLNSNNVDLLPMAVRYADIKNKIYVIERPPFQTDIDFYPNKKVNARLANHIPNKKIWIPWTVFVVSLGDSPEELNAMLFFNDKPLESFDDRVIKGYTPNLFGDARVCFGNSLFTFKQRIDQGDIKYNISNVYNYLFNDYFTQWNPDISPNYYSLFYNYFNQNKFIERVLSLKKYPKGIEDFSSWNARSASTPWIYVLFLLSTMTYEETMSLVSYFKTTVFQTHHVRYVALSEIITLRMQKNCTFNFQDNNFDFSERDFIGHYSNYMSAFKHAIQPSHRSKKIDVPVIVAFKDFPEDTNKSIIISEDTYAYIYSFIFDKINEALNELSNTPTLEHVIFNSSDDFYHFYSRFTNFFSYGSIHITINYNDYMNFIAQPLEGVYV